MYIFAFSAEITLNSPTFQISIEPALGKKVEHNGIKIELLGQIGKW